MAKHKRFVTNKALAHCLVDKHLSGLGPGFGLEVIFACIGMIVFLCMLTQGHALERGCGRGRGLGVRDCMSVFLLLCAQSYAWAWAYSYIHVLYIYVLMGVRVVVWAWA